MYAAIAVRIRALDCTLLVKHVCCREGVLGSNATTPKLEPKVFVARWRPLRNAPSKGHYSRYITLFFEGTYSVIGFYELMRMFLGKFNAFSEVILGIFEPFSWVLLA